MPMATSCFVYRCVAASSIHGFVTAGWPFARWPQVAKATSTVRAWWPLREGPKAESGPPWWCLKTALQA